MTFLINAKPLMPLLTVLLSPCIFISYFIFCTPNGCYVKQMEEMQAQQQQGGLRAAYQPTYRLTAACYSISHPKRLPRPVSVSKKRNSNKTEHVCGYEIVGDNLRTLLCTVANTDLRAP